MVNYSLTVDKRHDLTVRLMVFSGLFAAAVASILATWLPAVATRTRLPWLVSISPPSAMAVFALLEWLANNYLWNRWPLRLYLKIPDLNGSWEGKIIDRRDLKNHTSESDLPIRATVVQSMTSIDIVVVNEQSRPPTASQTVSASIDNANAAFIVLRDVFRYDEARGTSQLAFRSADQTLKGDFVSTFPRKGTLTLKRVSNVTGGA